MGINVAIASDNGGNQGIGFAIPSNTARKVIDELRRFGEVRRGYLGVALKELPSSRQKDLGLGADGGVEVVQVLPGQPAAKAGLRVGDVIVRFERDPLPKWQAMRHLRQLIADTTPETETTLHILRDGAPATLRVTVAKRPAELP
jgi:serine protease Do